MATVNLGRVGLVLKGDWDNATAYAALDLVSHDGNAWAAKRANTNVEPATENDDDWQLISNNEDLVSTVQGYKNDAADSATAAAGSATSAAASALSVTGAVAPTESTSTASRAYAVGEYFVYSGYLCETTAAIAQGGTITPGTNCVIVPNGLGGEVSNLNDETSGLEDVIKTGRHTYTFTWENGGINSTGNNSNNGVAYAVRTSSFFTNLNNKDITISANGTFTSSYYLRIAKYAMDGTYASNQSIAGNTFPQTVHFDDGYKYRMAWVGPSTATVSENDLSFVWVCEQQYTPAVIAAQVDTLDERIDALKVGDTPISVTWESGGINSAGNNNANITYAVRSVGFANGMDGKDIYISCAPGTSRYTYLTIFKYSSAGVFDSSQQINSYNMPTTVTTTAGSKYRLMWRNSHSETPSGTDLSLVWRYQLTYVPATVQNAIKAKAYDLSMADALVRAEKRNPFVFSAFDHPYISFVWDGPYPDLDKVAAIFKGYNYPICVGAMPSFMYATANGLSETTNGYTVGMTMPALLAKIVENGGEIMVHPDGYVTTINQDDYDNMYQCFVGDKEAIESYGFTVRGYVRHGGIDNIANGTPQIERWLIGNYEYGNQGTAVNFNLGRHSIADTLDNLKAKVDAAVAANGWLRFMCHNFDTTSPNGVSEETLVALLNYIQSISGVNVVTYATMFDTFSSSQFLESISE